MASLCIPLGPPGFPNGTKVGPQDTSATTRALSIQVTGRPIPSVVWLHNNVPIDVASNSRLSTSYEVDGDNRRAWLNITDVEPGDRGTYTLKVNNSYGSDKEEWQVPVICKEMTYQWHLCFQCPLNLSSVKKVNSIRKDHQNSVTRLVCTGAYHVEEVGLLQRGEGGVCCQCYCSLFHCCSPQADVQISWKIEPPNVDGNTYAVTAQTTTYNELEQQTEFETILEVSTCGNTPQLAKCILDHNGQQTPVEITFCSECSCAACMRV